MWLKDYIVEILNVYAVNKYLSTNDNSVRTYSIAMKLIMYMPRIIVKSCILKQSAETSWQKTCCIIKFSLLHCKNRRIVLTQLVYHSCILKIKNNPHVFACTQFKFQKQPSCFCSACTKHVDCFWSLNCNCGKQAGLKQLLQCSERHHEL